MSHHNKDFFGNIWPWPEKKPYTCPVCKGTGHMPEGFYNQTSGTWSTSGTSGTEKCRACNGKGIVWNK